jgi:uncharacterized protein (TIGR02145 family)
MKYLFLATTLFFLLVFNSNFIGQTTETLTDIDGNVYKTIKLGNDIWMAENLAVTHYNDGTPIARVTDKDQWIVTLTPAFRWYDNDERKNKYLGALYNWYVVDTKKLCPVGWHVSTEKEWELLAWTLGGNKVAGNKLRAKGNQIWEPSENIGTDLLGFNALPAGFVHDFNGQTSSFGQYASFWTSDEYSRAFGWGRSIHINYPELRRFNDGKKGGFSVRCIKNKE